MRLPRLAARPGAHADGDDVPGALVPAVAYVGNAPRQVEGLSGQQDGARADGNDDPLVLTGARLFDARGRTTHTMARASPRLGARPPARRRRRRAPSQPWSPVCVVNGRLRQRLVQHRTEVWLVF